MAEIVGILLIAVFGLAVSLIEEKHVRACLEKEVAKLKTEAVQWSLARSWAAEVEDFEEEEEKLRDALLGEENREMQAWNVFKQAWKPTWSARFRMRRKALPPETLAREAFWKWYCSEKPMLEKKSMALKEEQKRR